MPTKIRLSNDADYLLCILYDAYKKRQKNGELAFDSKLFGDSEIIQSDYIPQWPTEDIDDAAQELHAKGMLECQFSDCSLGQCFLLPDGIVYMEHRFGDKMDSLTQRISALHAAIFG